VDSCLCSSHFREWECAIQYSIIAAAATAIIITPYISTTRDINEYCQFCPHTCILTPSAVFINICISGRDNAISPSPLSVFIRNTRTVTIHNTFTKKCPQHMRFYVFTVVRMMVMFFGVWHHVVS
jgi:hypothetical protein